MQDLIIGLFENDLVVGVQVLRKTDRHEGVICIAFTILAQSPLDPLPLVVPCRA
jgi:hypothetical protein